MQRKNLILRTLLLGGIACGVAGCKSVTTFVERQTQETYESFNGKMVDTAASRRLIGAMSEQEALGLADEERRVTAERLEDAGPLEAYATDILKRLLAHYPSSAEPIKVVVTDGKAVTPQALKPSNVIELPYKFILEVESEDELAFILGHEAAHILFNHAADSGVFAESQKLRAMAASVGLYSVAARRGQSQVTSVDIGSSKPAALAVGAYAALETLDKEILSKAWRRTQEEEADLLAVDLMVAAGYNAEAADIIMQRLDSLHRSSDTENRDAQQKWQNLAGFLVTNITQGKTSGQQNLLSIGTVITSIQALSTVGVLGEKYLPALERGRLMTEYKFREHADAPQPAPETLRLRKAVYEGPGARALARPVVRDRVEALRAKGRLTEARTTANYLLRDAKDTNPDVRMLLANIEIDDGAPQKAREHLELAIRDPRAKLPVFDRLIGLYLDADQPGQALRVYDRMAERFPDKRATTLPDRIYLAHRAGRPAVAADALRECSTYARFDPDLFGRCEGADLSARKRS